MAFDQGFLKAEIEVWKSGVEDEAHWLVPVQDSVVCLGLISPIPDVILFDAFVIVVR